MKLVPKEVKKYQWLIFGLVILALLLFFRAPGEGQEGFSLPNEFFIIAAAGVGIYFYMKSLKKMNLIEDGYAAIDFINRREREKFDKQWDFTDPIIEPFAGYTLVQCKEGKTFGIDLPGNLKVRTPMSLYEVRRKLEASEIIKSGLLRGVEEKRLLQTVKESGLVVEDDEDNEEKK